MISGQAQTVQTHQGTYVYRPQETQDTRKTQLFLGGQTVRRDHVLISAQQEEALWQYRQQQLDALEPSDPVEARANALPARRRHRPVFVASGPNLKGPDWPKFVVVDGQNCAPHADFAQDSNWKAHLICWDGRHAK